MGTEQKVMLVTGAGGFVGRHMVDLLCANGHQVRATDLPLAARQPFPAGVEFMPSDITQADQVGPLLQGVERVFHIAAIFDYSAPEERLRRVNVIGTRNLVQAARAAGVKHFVYWSTGSVYGEHPLQTPTSEAYTPQPFVAYERTKYEGELVCTEEQRRGLPVTIIRPASIYGPGSLYAIGTLLQSMRRGLVKIVPGSGQARGAYVHVEDVCRAALFLSEHAAGADVFNVADDSAYTMNELLKFLAGQLQVRPPVVSVPASVLKAAGWALHIASKVTGRRPLLERDTIHYFLYDHLMDNSKIKSLGFQFKWPDTLAGMKDLVSSYAGNAAVRAS